MRSVLFMDNIIKLNIDTVVIHSFLQYGSLFLCSLFSHVVMVGFLGRSRKSHKGEGPGFY